MLLPQPAGPVTMRILCWGLIDMSEAGLVEFVDADALEGVAGVEIGGVGAGT